MPLLLAQEGVLVGVSPSLLGDSLIVNWEVVYSFSSVVHSSHGRHSRFRCGVGLMVRCHGGRISADIADAVMPDELFDRK